MGKAVPLRELVSRQPEPARQVNYTRARSQRSRRQFDRNLGRRAQEDDVDLAQVGLALLMRKTDQVCRGRRDGKLGSQTLARPLVAGHQPKGEVRMAS